MNPGAFTRRVAERLSGISRQQLQLRAGIGLATVTVFGVILLSGGTLSLFWSSFVVLAALVTMLIPHEFAPLVLLSGLAGLWAISVPDLFHPSAVLAAALLYAVHVLCVLASYGPPELVLDRELVRTWARRWLLAAAAAAATWLVSWLLGLAGRPGAEWLRVVGLGLVLVWIGFLATRLPRRVS